MNTSATIPEHIEVLFEKHLAGAASADEVRELRSFAADHAGLGAELEAMERTRETMTASTRTFVGEFDWSRAEKAFQTRLLGLQTQRRFLIATMTLWSVYAVWRAIGSREHLLPKRTIMERGTAAAPPIFYRAPQPNFAQLAQGTKAV